MAKKYKPEDTVTSSSGNVFADPGIQGADNLLVKSVLAIHIRRAMKVAGLTQVYAAKILGIDQPKVSAIINGKLDGFSTDRLLRFLNILGCDISDFCFRPSSRDPRSRCFWVSVALRRASIS